MMKLLAVLLMVGGTVMVSVLFQRPIRAAGDFSTEFISTYKLQEKGETQVTHEIAVSNNLPNKYLTKYTLSIGSEGIAGLAVTVNGSRAPFASTVNGSVTDVTVTVPHPVIGVGQVLHLKVEYRDTVSAVRYGDTWEVNIPRLSRANEAESYRRVIIVPPVMGSPAIEAPRASSRASDSDGNTVLEYTGFPNQSLALLFGDKLTYQLDLTYNISNPGTVAADTEIALPPDTEYQQIVLGTVNPQPKYIRVDSDGNWLAVYPLKAREESQVTATVFATVYPQPHFPALQGDRSRLIQPAEYWESQSSAVVDLAAQLKTPEYFYDYLRENFVYDFDRIGSGSERLGAVKALNSPQTAICTEFTDTFIALSRAQKIPSRELIGFAVTAGSDLLSSADEDFLHAWPEYYDDDRKTWIQVDPTLGTTMGGTDYFSKLDFGHIVFVRHGAESDYPYPAGTYKSEGGEKTVAVKIAADPPAASAEVKVERMGSSFIARNSGNSAVRQYKVDLEEGNTHTIEYLAPLATLEITSSNDSGSGLIFRLKNFLRNLYGSIRQLYT